MLEKMAYAEFSDESESRFQTMLMMIPLSIVVCGLDFDWSTLVISTDRLVERITLVRRVRRSRPRLGGLNLLIEINDDDDNDILNTGDNLVKKYSKRQREVHWLPSSNSILHHMLKNVIIRVVV